VFGRSKIPPPPVEDATEKVGGKGHATPSRKEAEAANRRPLVPVARTTGPRDKATKETRAAERAQARQLRDAEFRAMQEGDEAHMPVQHRGPVRRYIRDVVDSKRTLSEFFLPLAIVMLLAAMVLSGPLSNQGVTGARAAMALMALPYVYLLVAVLDAVWRWRVLKRDIARKFKDVPRGSAGYYTTRMFQMRRLRMPKPQIDAGELPR